MTTGLAPLGDDHIGAVSRRGPRVVHGGDHGHDLDPPPMARPHELGPGDAPHARLDDRILDGEELAERRAEHAHSAWKSAAAFLWATRSATPGASSPRIRRVHVKSRLSMAGSKRRGAHTSIPIRKRSGIFSSRAFHAGSSGPVSVARSEER